MMQMLDRKENEPAKPTLGFSRSFWVWIARSTAGKSAVRYFALVYFSITVRRYMGCFRFSNDGKNCRRPKQVCFICSHMWLEIARKLGKLTIPSAALHIYYLGN